MVNSLSASASDTREAGFIPGLGRYPGGGHDNQAMVNRVAKSWT